MRKIKYPFETDSEKEKFLEDYVNIIFPIIPNHSIICEKIKEIDPAWNLRRLLTADFFELIEFSQKNKKENLCTFFKPGTEKKDYLYSDLQSIIADFFVNQNINIKTCFYCNIEYINSFKNKYASIEEFINEAPSKSLYEILNSYQTERIAKERKSKALITDDIREIFPKKGKYIIEKINQEYSKEFNNEHFTLDHVLPKDKYPFLSLSLFNLVPSCYSCNSRFKHSKEFNLDENLPKIIPSATEYDFDELAQFKLKFKENENNNGKLDLKVELTNLSNIKNVDEYTTMFQLKGRYQYHQQKAEDLIDKRKNYSDSQIKEISKLIRRDEQSIKKDLFGKECFESSNEPFEKYKQDIAKQLGLL